MLQLRAGLSAAELRAVAELELRVTGADGGRLKLEWAALTARDGAHVDDLLWWEGGRLVGFLGLYGSGPALELAGMVDPVARRGGIAATLLDAAVPLARERGYRSALLIVPRPSAAGRSLALRRGAVLDHSEHALVLATEPSEGPADSRVTLRRAGRADAAEVADLLAAGFGYPVVPELDDQTGADQERTLVIEVAGAPVGTLRLTHHGEQAGIYGLAIHPAWRGRGIGGDVLRRVCRQLRRDGAERIGLEVAVGNARALNLYTRVGFVAVATEDYYALSTG